MKLYKGEKIIIAILFSLATIGIFLFAVWVTKSSICGSWEVYSCKDTIDGYSKIIGIVTALATLIVVGISAFYAVGTYRRNAALEHAKWLFNLYEKFYEKGHLKEIRNKLDCDETSKDVENLVQNQPFEFTDYLNFFEFVAFLKNSNQITIEEVQDLFGYYLNCLSWHQSVRSYLKPTGYELLENMLKEIADNRKKSMEREK